MNKIRECSQSRTLDELLNNLVSFREAVAVSLFADHMDLPPHKAVVLWESTPEIIRELLRARAGSLPVSLPVGFLDGPPAAGIPSLSEGWLTSAGELIFVPQGQRPAPDAVAVLALVGDPGLVHRIGDAHIPRGA